MWGNYQDSTETLKKTANENEQIKHKSSNIDLIKKMFLEEASDYNRKQEVQKRYKKKMRVMTEKDQFSQLNSQAFLELQREEEEKVIRKMTIQKLLKKQYEHEIHMKNRVKTESRNDDRKYAQLEQQRQQFQDQRREVDLMRMYKHGSKASEISPESQNKQKNRLESRESNNNKDNSSSENQYHFNHFNQKPRESQDPLKIKSRQNPENHLEYKFHLEEPLSTLNFKNQLKLEAERKKHEEKLRKQMRLNFEKQYIERQKEAYIKMVQSMRIKKILQKNAYKQELDEQLALKKQFSRHYQV